jgi:hypothetical protein
MDFLRIITDDRPEYNPLLCRKPNDRKRESPPDSAVF